MSSMNEILNTALIGNLIEVTGKWNQHDEISDSDEVLAKEIGKKLFLIGGMNAMQDAYYEAKERNKYASVLNHVWDGIGDWRS